LKFEILERRGVLAGEVGLKVKRVQSEVDESERQNTLFICISYSKTGILFRNALPVKSHRNLIASLVII